MIRLVIFLGLENGLLTWLDHLTLVIYFRHGQPFILICTGLLEHYCLIITSTHSQHEAHGTPAASPDWVTE